MPHPTCSSSLLIVVTSLLLVQFSEQNDLLEVNFQTIGGRAGASPSFFEPKHAFETDEFWHSLSPWTGSASVWWDFYDPIRVVEFSFRSRDRAAFTKTVDDPYFPYLTRQDGPSKYTFWGSDHHDCSDESYWVTLHRDYSGTEFTIANEPKKASIVNYTSYRCYGFKVLDVPGRKDGAKVATIQNIRFYSHCNNKWDDEKCKNMVDEGRCDNALAKENCKHTCGKCSW